MIGLLLTLLLGSSTAPVSEASESATAAALRARILEEERDLLESARTRGRVDENLRRLADEKRSAVERLAAVENERALLQQRLDHLGRREAAMRDELERLHARTGRRLALLARQSAARPLEVLLTAANPADFVYRYHALKAVAAAERRMVERIRDAGAELVDVQLALDAELIAAYDLGEQAASEVARIDALEQLHREQMDLLVGEEDERRLWLAEMRKQAVELGLLLEGLPARDGKAARPSNSHPVAGERVATFGESDPLMAGLLVSDGWRYRAAAGAPVVAVASGKVMYAGWFQGYGNLIILDHGGGVNTLYAHVAELSVKQGNVVIAGEIMAGAGASGSIGEPGLYFEVRRNGRPIDPAGWIKEVGNAASTR